MCDPLLIDSSRGNKYFVIFIDDYNKKLWNYLIKKKSYVIDVFTKFKSMVERQSGHKIKVLRIDEGGEYMLKDFDTLCTKQGIMHGMVPP